MALLTLLPLAGAGCHKLTPDQASMQTVTLTGTAVASVGDVEVAAPSSRTQLFGRRTSGGNVPLAYARVEALDASLRPIPGVKPAITDAAGRYTLEYTLGTQATERTVVLRVSSADNDRHIDVMAVTRVQAGEGTQVVNADAASHVAANVLLKRAGGLDAALDAVGAPELRGVVDIVRRSLGDKAPGLDSKQAVDAAVSAEQQEQALSPVLARLDKAAIAAAAAKPAENATLRMVASATATSDAPAPLAAAPSPTPAPTAAPAAADTYKVAPQTTEVAEAAPARTVQSHGQPQARRRSGPEFDPYGIARDRAAVAPDPAVTDWFARFAQARAVAIGTGSATGGDRAQAGGRPAVRRARRDRLGLAAKSKAVATGTRPGKVATVQNPRSGRPQPTAAEAPRKVQALDPPAPRCEAKRLNPVMWLFAKLLPGFHPPTSVSGL